MVEQTSIQTIGQMIGHRPQEARPGPCRDTHYRRRHWRSPIGSPRIRNHGTARDSSSAADDTRDSRPPMTSSSLRSQTKRSTSKGGVSKSVGSSSHAVYEELFRKSDVPVCTPRLAEIDGLSAPKRPLYAPFLCDAGEAASLWSRWLEAIGHGKVAVRRIRRVSSQPTALTFWRRTQHCQSVLSG